MTEYRSTRNRDLICSDLDALLCGPAPDGGLFAAENIPVIDMEAEKMGEMDYVHMCAMVLSRLLPSFSEEEVLDLIKAGYGDKFDAEDKVVLAKAGRNYCLELYHGPTSAFKDMALCLLPQFIASANRKKNETKDTLILTATSGDTGKAALAGFADVPGTKIIVFYPRGGVSQVQKAQMATQEGCNVDVCAIEGNFDDAQTAVKKAFAEVRSDAVKLSSANSINIGRLAPQVTYYFYAYLRLVREGSLKYGDKLDFCVPTGNFGDILAGYIAEKMGLPVGKLICASNSNNVLSDFIRTGVYDKRRALLLTDSPSMDILVSSNLERLLYYVSGCNSDVVREKMLELNKNGVYTMDDAAMDKIRSKFECGWADDKACAETIRKTWEEDHYLIDPHTAVAVKVAQDLGKENCVILSTASPYKFAPAILRALGMESPENGFDAIDMLESATGVKAPVQLKELRNKAIRFEHCIDPASITQYVERKAEEKTWQA